MLSVEEALILMAKAVQRGDFEEAAGSGNRATVPLGTPRADLALGALLSAGQQAAIHCGTLRGRPVAVKKARISTHQDLDKFRKELRLMAAVRHANVVPLLAAHVLPPDYWLAMPLQRTSLEAELHERGWRPSWPALTRLGAELAAGLAAVHAAGVLHRDVKPGNILLGEDGVPRLGDFGLAEAAEELAVELADARSVLAGGKPSGGFYKRHVVGTLEYMAPEVLQRLGGGAPADVYALAVTLNEAAIGARPFLDCTRDNPACQTVLNYNYGRQELAAAVAAEGLRPTQASGAPSALNCLLAACWALDPAARPTAAVAADELARLACSGDFVASPALERHATAPVPPSCDSGSICHCCAEAALMRAFVGLDTAFRETEDRAWQQRVARMGAGAAGARTWPGATALAALLHGGWLAVAGAGDCRAVLCRDGAAVALSRDQTAARADERERVAAAGGDVRWRMDGWRVGAAGLQVTRSLGDADLKAAGVIAEPEVTLTELLPADAFVVLASDGLWDVVPDEDAVGLVLDTVKDPAMCARRLATEALTRGAGDNITVIVAFLRPLTTLEEVFSGGRQARRATRTEYGTRRDNTGGHAADEARDTY
ncbi:hypothetical protein WJX81_000555 [Elliptochloris bilobata]|uniref:Protein kinase domain-containing protein n=1 Tax=Elliptochloris bilobata TaxID=381761 RepID=A0AAW1RHW9_9CHLO